MSWTEPKLTTACNYDTQTILVSWLNSLLLIWLCVDRILPASYLNYKAILHVFFFVFFLQCLQSRTSSGVSVCPSWVCGRWGWELQAQYEREVGALQQTVSAREAGREQGWWASREAKAEGVSVPHATHHCGGSQPGEHVEQQWDSY